MSLSAWFEPQGLLSQRLEGFRSRPSQAALAQAIASAIDHRELLVAEAGTGIGKTYAYLIPALLSGQKVLVSTASRALQDQLFSRDIPRLLKAMGLTGVSVARLKGRSNYLCPYRLERARQEGRLSSAQEVQDLRQIVQFSALSPEGDISACTTVSEHSMVWPLVTSTVDNCLGQRCPMVAECPVIRAREQAQKSELVIVNHHLLCADLALRREGGGELLPRMDLVVVDEAHALSETALQFFGLTVSTHGLALLARDALVAGLELARDGADWAGLSGQLEAAVLSFRAELAAACAPGRHKWEQLSPGGQSALQGGLTQIAEALGPLHMALCVNAERHAELIRLESSRCRIGLICWPPLAMLRRVCIGLSWGDRASACTGPPSMLRLDCARCGRPPSVPRGCFSLQHSPCPHPVERIRGTLPIFASSWVLPMRDVNGLRVHSITQLRACWWSPSSCQIRSSLSW
ncbi:MAG: ATP-dependent DNA helicase [Burkholderiaceae bacterium]